MTRSLAVILAVAIASEPAAGQASPGDAARCGQSYGGFDTRLTPRLLSILPEGSAEPVGFEMTAAGPVVATSDRLYAIRGDETVALPVPAPLVGIAVDATGRLALQSARGVEFVGPSSLQPVGPWTRLEGRVHNTGQTTFLEAVDAGTLTRIGVRSPLQAGVLPVVELPGPLRALSWDQHGMVAVAGNALLRWVPDKAALERLAVDTGLEQATDVCVVDAERVVVTLSSATLLFTGQTMSVLAAIGGRCRIADDTLFLYSPRLRRVWSLEGIGSVGGRQRDLAHAHRLLRLAITQSVPYIETREFGEAVRLLGCREATRVANDLRR